jgi:two-component system LytT family response regulator
MIRALVVDDEPVARRRVRRLLAGETDVAVVGECGDGRSAIDLIRKLTPDLVFLDVQMPEGDGFDVLRALPDPIPAIVFVTAFDHYALSAFEVHALDYLLKPFDRARFARTVARAREHLARREERHRDDRLVGLLNDLRAKAPHLTRFVVPAGGRIRLIEAGQVDWIEAADNYVVLHAGGVTHIVRETMSRLEGELDPATFVRIHRSTIVRLDRIAELRPSFHGDFVVVLFDGTQLTLSRTHRPRVEALLRRRL